MKIMTPDGQLGFIWPLKVWRTAAGRCPECADSLQRPLKQAPPGWEGASCEVPCELARQLHPD